MANKSEDDWRDATTTDSSESESNLEDEPQAVSSNLSQTTVVDVDTAKAGICVLPAITTKPRVKKEAEHTKLTELNSNSNTSVPASVQDFIPKDVRPNHKSESDTSESSRALLDQPRQKLLEIQRWCDRYFIKTSHLNE